MGNYNKWGNSSKADGKYYVHLFVSRNKDNENVKDFKQRREAFLCRDGDEKINRRWYNFIYNAKEGEFCRHYISLNARDENKIKKELLIELIQNSENYDLTSIESKIAGIAARKECAAEKMWFFDFDSSDEIDASNFIDDIIAIDSSIEYSCYHTPHGYAIAINHGLDTRELLKKWGDIATLKKDDLICFDWYRKITFRKA